MLVLPRFELEQPETIEQAAAALAAGNGEAMLLAGGTDLLPNLKHGLFEPRRLVSLRRVAELRGSRETSGGGLFLGAGMTLTEVAAHAAVRARYPALARAASLVAGPQLRNMGTLGGNLCLDTRCVYYNQTRFWRDALGYCLKKDGTECHVVPGGSRCVAAHSADTPGPVIAYGATVSLRSVRGTRTVPVAEFFRGEGTRNTVREADEILTGVTLPRPAPGLRSAYEKLRMRQAIDFPLLTVAVAAVPDADERMETMTVVVSGLGAKPRVVGRVGPLVRGRKLDVALAAEVGEHTRAQCHPLSNLNVDPAWRRDVLPVLVRRALLQMV
jgi:4-hydroxybenzoyl-CoA reductase subunit beta